MMILRSSPASPFGRKVKIAAALLGLSDAMNVVQTDTGNPEDPLRRDNPLGKIPTLVIEDGTVVYDSGVIVEYLDLRAGGGRIIPVEPTARIRAQTLHALADGIMEAALLKVYEGRWRDAAKHESKWLEHQTAKIERALDSLEAAPPSFAAGIDVGHIALACALGYLDLRFAGSWRERYPRLVEWLAGFEASVPAYGKTRAP